MTAAEPVIFLYGADMDPVAVRAAYPEARFIARAQVGADAVPGPALAEPQEAVWGILVRVSPDQFPNGDAAVIATTDDGREVGAVPVTSQAALADAAQVLAAARYWELLPAYVAALAGAA